MSQSQEQLQLSVIIVNYNVQHFLEQALLSVFQASQNISAEVFVVDNNSTDGSVQMVIDHFPQVKLISNRKNVGFSAANNQAIIESKGKYILLLNPDTVVQKDTFEKVISFMDRTMDAGGLGVKMIDGTGTFLPESKRGLPTPEVAFYKIAGLSKLFPKSKKFGRYHLGYLDKDEIHEVEVLSGAFMLLRKECLDKIGLLDETFFMYGEDIDLSYRVILGGYKNYYYPETTIIHYKGESTRKQSVNYVFVFYKAMVIFANKHFSKKNARVFSFLINLAVYFSAFLALLNRFFKGFIIPLTDAALIFGGMYFLKSFWESSVKHAQTVYYPFEFMAVAVPLYILTWLIAVYFNGGYDRPLKLIRIGRGILTGTIAILVIYALLPEEYRYSRALIILGALWAFSVMTIFRLMGNAARMDEFVLEDNRRKRILIAGSLTEGKRVLDLMAVSRTPFHFIGFVQPKGINDSSKDELYIGSLMEIKKLTTIYGIDEVIFCGKDIESGEIINIMSELSTTVDYKIAPENTQFVIGSNSINKNGELYALEINSITKPANKRNKRVLDILVSLILLGLSPFLIIFLRRPFGLFNNIFRVFFGLRTWVGYNAEKDILPKIKPGVLSPVDFLKEKPLEQKTVNHLDLLYAKDYRVYNDIGIIYKGFSALGRS